MLPADARLAATPGLDRPGLERLRRAEVTIVGVGVLGGQLAHHLGLLGVGLRLVDCGRVESVNLGNQGFDAGSVGEWKTEARARQITTQNPACRVRTVNGRVEDLGLAAFAGTDLIATGLDGRAARVRVNEIAWRLGVPWVDAAVDGTGRWLHGTVTARDPNATDTACFVCAYGSRDLAAIAAEGRGPGCPSWRETGHPLMPPTLQASAFGGVVAGFQALWAVRLLVGAADGIVGRQLVVDADGVPTLALRGRRGSARCAFDHERFAPLTHDPNMRVADVLAAARAALRADVDEIQLHGRTVALGLVCPRCGARRELVRVVHAYSDAEVRCGCRDGAEMVPQRLVTSVAGADLARVAPLTWEQLGFPLADVVTLHAGERRLHRIIGGSTHA